MDDKLKRTWIRELRFGHYEQGRTHLRGEDNKYCCLGVLCDILEPDAWGGNPEECGYEHPMREGGSNWLNEEALSEVGIEPEQMRRLASLNDEGVEFAHIADIIDTFM